MTTLSPTAAKRVFLILSTTRWLPVGFVVGLFTLVARERGLTIQQITLYMTAQGIMVFLLELPTSGFADALGRRPLLLVAGVVNIGAGLAFLFAQSFWQFALSAALMGVYRALDSGPLEAWYVDTVHEREPGADEHRAMSAQGVLVGVGMGGGALVSGALVAWHPFRDSSALLLPVQVFVALSVVHLVATIALLRETPRSDSGLRARLADSVRETPVVVADGIRLVTRNRVLAGLVAVELFWVTGMVAYETLMPLRL
jgi:MFS family permease